MFHFDRFLFLSLNLLLTSVLLMTPKTVLAEEDTSQGDESKMVYSNKSLWGISLGYLSWQENLTLQNGSTKDYGYTNFSGNSLDVSYEFYFSGAPRHGFRFDGSVASGVATTGGAQAVLSYQFANVAWTAESLSAIYTFQLSPTITLGAGPLFLMRQISYQNLSTGTSASSGASTNFGGEGDLRVNLTQHWDLQFLFAGLSNNATSLWDFSVGYLF